MPRSQKASQECKWSKWSQNTFKLNSKKVIETTTYSTLFSLLLYIYNTLPTKVLGRATPATPKPSDLGPVKYLVNILTTPYLSQKTDILRK